MLKSLKLTNVGVAPDMEIKFSKRLNLLTGDNGLGKSFLLDIAWWALTRIWPAELNRQLTTGLMAKPRESGKATIMLDLTAKSTQASYESVFNRKAQAWSGPPGRPWNPGLVLYAQVDGSFAVWDPARNYWFKKGDVVIQDRPPAYVFSTKEVWDGLWDKEENLLCNGLISDWAGWQKEKGEAFKQLCAVLKALSPSVGEKIEPGELTRVSLNDPRDIPTLKMPYGLSVPVVHASAGIRRIIALAYLLVWCWEEHKKASKLLDQKNTKQIVFLIDEIEAHLHPKWQRTIVKALLGVMDALAGEADVQVIAATHSPLVMASVEALFDSSKDAWFDFDFIEKEGRVELSRREFERRGDVSNWLMSKEFGLLSARSEEAEKVLEDAERAMQEEGFGKEHARKLHKQLLGILGETDPFWMRWRYVAEKKGWLP